MTKVISSHSQSPAKNRSRVNSHTSTLPTIWADSCGSSPITRPNALAATSHRLAKVIKMVPMTMPKNREKPGPTPVKRSINPISIAERTAIQRHALSSQTLSVIQMPIMPRTPRHHANRAQSEDLLEFCDKTSSKHQQTLK